MAGKYTPGDGVKAEPGRRAKFDFPPVDKEKADRIVVAMREIAKAHGVSVARVGLAWVRQKPFVTSTIIGATTMEQLNDNLESVNFTLSAEEMAQAGRGQRRPDAVSPLDDQAATTPPACPPAQPVEGAGGSAPPKS